MQRARSVSCATCAAARIRGPATCIAVRRTFRTAAKFPQTRARRRFGCRAAIAAATRVRDGRPRRIRKIGAFSASVRPRRRAVSAQGQSDWNEKNLFTGWADVPLTILGKNEAAAGATWIWKEGLQFDVAYRTPRGDAADGSRRRRGCDVDSPWIHVAAPPRLRRGAKSRPRAG